MEGEWTCYKGGQFNGWRMGGHIIEVSLMESMAMLLGWPV